MLLTLSKNKITAKSWLTNRVEVKKLTSTH